MCIRGLVQKIVNLNVMQGVGNGKIVLAQQINNCKNTKLKLLLVNETIWFNKQCQTHHVTPKYAQFHLKDIVGVWWTS
jgi:hypothetical protein